MYKSLVKWRDIEDGYIYNVGEPFPHDGREIPAERIAKLTSTQNKAGFAVIKAVQTPVEEIPEQMVEQPAKPKKSRKKTT